MKKVGIGIIILMLLLIGGSSSCSKNLPDKEQGYLNLRIDEEEHDISWQYLTTSWNPDERSLKMEGTGYQYRICRIDLKNLQANGVIPITELDQLYYEDGVQFIPDTVTGDIRITEMNVMHIKGTIEAHFTDRGRNEQVRLKGDFYSPGNK